MAGRKFRHLGQLVCIPEQFNVLQTVNLSTSVIHIHKVNYDNFFGLRILDIWPGLDSVWLSKRGESRT